MPLPVAYDRQTLMEVVIYHGRMDLKGCLCGWAELGKSHAEHVATVYEECVTKGRDPRREFLDRKNLER